MLTRNVFTTLLVTGGMPFLTAAAYAESAATPAITPELSAAMGQVLGSQGVSVTTASLARDKLYVSPGGRKVVITGDGVAHPLVSSTLLNNLKVNVSTTLPAAIAAAAKPCPPVTITTSSGPATYDLQQEGYMTQVENQLQRGDCNTFASVGILEIEYVVAYGKTHSAAETASFAQTFQLSEQYLDVMRNITYGPGTVSLDGGIDAGNLLMLNPTCGDTPILGLPLLSQWPQIEAEATMDYEMAMAVPLVAPPKSGSTGPLTQLVAGDTASFELLLQDWGPLPTLPYPLPPALTLSNNLSQNLNADLANFGWNNLPAPSPLPTPTPDQAALYQGMFPPPSVHEAAFYAPMSVVQISHYDANNCILNSSGNCEGGPTEVLPTPCLTPLPHGGSKPNNIWDYSTFPIVTPTQAATAFQTTCYAALAAPYEELLSQNHPIAFGLDVDVWNWDVFSSMPTGATQVLDFSTTPNTTSGTPVTWPYTADHAVILIGYDHTRQMFHIRNSWGNQWGGDNDGTTWMTYDLFFRTVHDALYINGVYQPSNPPIPNGIWFGFWQGVLNGVSGVADINQYANGFVTDVVGQDTIWIASMGNPAGTFYGSDGSQTLIQVTSTGFNTSNNTYWAQFSNMNTPPGALFTLTRTLGTAMPVATFAPAGAAPSNPPLTWSKCDNNYVTPYNVLPQNYTELVSDTDPYLLPPCNTSLTPWRTTPTWTCHAGDTYMEYVGYNETIGGVAFDTVTRGCLSPGEAPKCPTWNGPMTLQVDGEPIQYTESAEILSPTASPWLDVCLPNLPKGGVDSSCLATAGGGSCWLPYCPAPKSVFGSTTATLNLGASLYVDSTHKLSNNGDWVKQGPDVCVSEVYAPAIECPSGYAPSPNGNDCLLVSRACPAGYESNGSVCIFRTTVLNQSVLESAGADSKF